MYFSLDCIYPKFYSEIWNGPTKPCNNNKTGHVLTEFNSGNWSPLKYIACYNYETKTGKLKVRCSYT